jgi:hypothetical protein
MFGGVRHEFLQSPVKGCDLLNYVVREDVTSIKGHKYVEATTIQNCANGRTVLEVCAI